MPAQLERRHYFRALYVEGGAQSGVARYLQERGGD